MRDWDVLGGLRSQIIPSALDVLFHSDQIFALFFFRLPIRLHCSYKKGKKKTKQCATHIYIHTHTHIHTHMCFFPSSYFVLNVYSSATIMPFRILPFMQCHVAACEHKLSAKLWSRQCTINKVIVKKNNNNNRLNESSGIWILFCYGCTSQSNTFA